MKTYFIMLCFCGLFYNVKAQDKINNLKQEYSISIKESEKNKIDWNEIKNHFETSNQNDSIEIKVNYIPKKVGKITSEKKYSVKGIKKNLDELITRLKKMIK